MTHTAAPDILAPGTFAIAASGLYLEGLAVDQGRGVVWYSDVIAGGVHGIGPDGWARVLNPDRMWTGGIMLNEDGRVLSSGQHGIMWNDPDTGESGWLIERIGGEPINGINEMVADGHGGMFCGTVDIEQIIKGEPTRPATLYHLAQDGTARIAADGLGFANGIMLSPDGRRLYYNDTFDGVYAFDVSPDLELSNRRQLLKKEDADGMAMDAQGNLLVTGYKSGFIQRLSPEGEELGRIETPAGGITQVRFGGPDMCDMWLTAVAADAGDTLAVGEVPSEPNSFLYRGRVAEPALPLALARFRLG
jgi:sugar lactone lactonase YvrE